MKKVVPVILVLALAAAGGYLYQHRGDGGDGVLTLYGNVDVRQVELAFRVGGRIDEVLVDEGDAVSAGDVVARLDAGPLKDELALREAEVAEKQATLSRLRSGPRPQEIEQAAAVVAEREAAVNVATVAYRRAQSLLDRFVGSQAERDDAHARMVEARARLEAARESLKLLQAGTRTEDIAAGEAALAAARSRRDLARTALADTQLRAPNAGVVLTRVREPGAIVSAGQPLLTVTLTDPVWVRAYVDEPDLGRIEPGMQASVYTDSAPGKAYAGQIGFISPQAEFTPKSVETPELRTALVYRLRVIVQDPDGGLRQGMPVTVKLPHARARPSGGG